jgi:inhibitor of cysteine peptidase
MQINAASARTAILSAMVASLKISRRRFALTLAVGLGVAAFALTTARAAEMERTGAVGDSYALELDGNPSTGYRWKLSEAKSGNLRILRIDDLGYRAAQSTPGKLIVGAPAPYRFRVTLLAAGSATIVFEYLRPWEGRAIKTFEQSVQVRGQ